MTLAKQDAAVLSKALIPLHLLTAANGTRHLVYHQLITHSQTKHIIQSGARKSGPTNR
jgi:hypothetical protein